jgi:hypothetical protein
MEHGLAPEAAIKTWASQPQFGLSRSKQMDRHHFHAFVSHLVQVIVCIQSLFHSVVRLTSRMLS